MENQESVYEHEITIPGLLTLHKNGKITRFEIPMEEQAVPPSIHNNIASKDINVTHQLQARIFLPTISPSIKLLPLILFFHGGGFVSLSSASPLCHNLCNKIAIKAQAIVISVNYRLAPEHRLPAAFEDGFSSLNWLKSQALSQEPIKDPWLASYADFTRVYLAGVSAGASIAHHVALQTCTTELKPLNLLGIVLVVPFLGGQVRTQSEVALGESSSLPLKGCDNCWALSLPIGATRDHPFSNVIPTAQILWADKSIPWPPSLIVIGGRDILHDRQVEYTQQLQAADKKVHLARFEHADHFLFEKFGDLMLEEIAKFVV